MSNSLLHVKPLNRWDKDSIRPGNVGPVGDVASQVRLRHNYPGARIRWDSTFTGKAFTGQNIQDGASSSWQTGGRNALTINGGFVNMPAKKTNHGYVLQDVYSEDSYVEPKLGTTGQWNWRNQQASTINAKSTGALFEPLPGIYGLAEGDIPRGGNYPRIVGATGLVPLNDTFKTINNPVTGEIIRLDADGRPITTNNPGYSGEGTAGTTVKSEIDFPTMTVDLPEDNLPAAPGRQRNGLIYSGRDAITVKDEYKNGVRAVTGRG